MTPGPCYEKYSSITSCTFQIYAVNYCMFYVGFLLSELVQYPGYTALTAAAYRGRTAVVKLLIESGADIEATCNVRARKARIFSWQKSCRFVGRMSFSHQDVLSRALLGQHGCTCLFLSHEQSPISEELRQRRLRQQSRFTSSFLHVVLLNLLVELGVLSVLQNMGARAFRKIS